MLNRALAYLTAIVMVAGMMACGGSSSGTTPIIVPPPPASHLPITQANATDITGDVIDAVSSLFEIVAVADVTNLPFPDIAASQSGLAISSGQPVGKNIDWTKSLIVDTGSCDTGSYTTTWDDVDDNLEASTGDTFEISFSSCFFSDFGVTLSGDASITSLVITGDPNGIPPWSIAANFAFSNLVGNDGGGASTINGDVDFSFSTVDGVTVDLEISGTELIVVEDGATDRLSNFIVTESIDTNTLMITLDAMGALTREAFNGTVNFDTPASLVILGNDDNPSSGEMLITHATSSVLATVLDNINVQLAIDENGDGTAETTLVVTWSDLQSD